VRQAGEAGGTALDEAVPRLAGVPAIQPHRNGQAARRRLPSPSGVRAARAAPQPARSTQIVSAIAVTLALLATNFVATSISPTPIVYLVGGPVILAIPALVAFQRGTLRAHGPEVLLTAAFYLSMFHAPLLRVLLGSGHFRSIEIEVLGLGVYAAYGVSLLLCLRPGAYAPVSPLPDQERRAAQLDAYAGLATAGIGYLLLFGWIASVGVDQLFGGTYSDVYLYSSRQAIVNFQYLFIVVGVATMSSAFARWPEPGPSTALRVAYGGGFVLFVAITARLGLRGPAMELALAVFLARAGTRRPVSRRTMMLVGGLFAAMFVFVSAMRTRLAGGVEGTSAGEIASQVQTSVDGDALGEFELVFQNHVMMAELAGIQMPYLEGESYASIPVQLVPRQIVGEKERSLSEWWMQRIDPAGARAGGGRAFGSFTEGYLNFGATGGVAQVVVVTLLLLTVYRFFPARTFGVAPAAAVMLAHAYHCHRSELVVDLCYLRNVALVTLAAIALRWASASLLRPEPRT
jgi:hypothetical protein